MKKTVWLALLTAGLLLASGCVHNLPPAGSAAPSDPIPQSAQSEPPSFVNPAGGDLTARFRVPDGYRRVQVEADSFGAYVRRYPLKPDGSPVLLFDGREKGNRQAYAAVFALPLEAEDLQQCADSVMRFYGEYHYTRGEYDRIVYTLGGGFTADFSKWSRGYGIGLEGNTLYWYEAGRNDTSYPSFQRFMRMVFAFSGTMNMEADSVEIPQDELEIGDLFIKGGSPGHVVMVVDVCENEAGEKAFLLAQGYMPAQEFHVLRNPAHPDDPWYYEAAISYPFRTAEYTFPIGSLKRLNRR